MPADKTFYFKTGDVLESIGTLNHDEMISAVSQMPQILSSLMADMLNSQSEGSLNFAGQGLRDVSRLADSDGQMWSELLVENQNELSSRIDRAIAALGELKNALKN